MAAKNSDKLEPLLQKARVLRDKIIYSAGGQSKKAVEKLHEEEVKMGEDISNLINSMETDAKEVKKFICFFLYNLLFPCSVLIL